MNASRDSAVGRRTLLKASAAAAALQVTSPFIIRALGDTPVRIGLVDPLTGVYAAIAQSEVEGAKLATEQVTKRAAFSAGPSHYWLKTLPTMSALVCRRRAS